MSWFQHLKTTLFSSVYFATKWDQADSNILNHFIALHSLFWNKVGWSGFQCLQTILFSCVLYSAILQQSGIKPIQISSNHVIFLHFAILQQSRIKLIQISSNHFIFRCSLFSDFATKWDQTDSDIFKPRYFPDFRDFATKWDQADSDIFKPLYFPAFFISRFWDKVGLSWFQYLQTTLFSCALYSAILRHSGIKLIQISSNHFIFLHSLFCDFETKWDWADSNIFKPLYFPAIFTPRFCDKVRSSWFKYLQTALFSWVLYSAILWQSQIKLIQYLQTSLFSCVSRFCDKVGSTWFRYLQTTLFSWVLYSTILGQSRIKLIQISSNHFIFLHSLFHDLETKWDQADSNILKPLYFPAFFISWFFDKVGLSWFQYLQTILFSCVLYFVTKWDQADSNILNHFIVLHSLFCNKVEWSWFQYLQTTLFSCVTSRYCDKVGSSWFKYLQTTFFSCVLYSAILWESGIKLIRISSN